MEEDTPRLLAEIDELRRRLEETERRLERAQRIDSLGQLTAGIVHDLSNLIAPLLGASSLLARQVAPGSPASVTVSEIRTTTERCAALVRQVLTFMRGEPPRFEVLSLNAVLLDMRALLERLVGPDVTLSLVLGDVGDTLADRQQLEQVIVNLAANARDAMPAGGTLTLRTANVDINPTARLRDGMPVTATLMIPTPSARDTEPPTSDTLAIRTASVELDHQDLSASGKYVALMITDTGSGMTPETQARAFEGLFTTKGEEGTGLGLTAARHFAARSGGRVTVWSKVGVGTTLVVHLPRISRSAALTSGEPSSETG